MTARLRQVNRLNYTLDDESKQYQDALALEFAANEGKSDSCGSGCRGPEGAPQALKDTQDWGFYAHTQKSSRKTLKFAPKRPFRRSEIFRKPDRVLQACFAAYCGLFDIPRFPESCSSISPRSEIFRRPNRVLQACFAFCDQKRLLRSPEKKQLHVRGENRSISLQSSFFDLQRKNSCMFKAEKSLNFALKQLLRSYELERNKNS